MNASLAPEVSVVIPAYREGSRLTPTVDAVRRACEALGRSFEVIVVVDGPEPETLRCARAAGDRPGVRVMVNEQNRGKGFTVRRGVLASAGRYVLFTDADLSIPIDHAGPFFEALDHGADVVIASRRLADAVELGSRVRGRRPMSQAFAWVVRQAALPGVSDSQCGFKAFRGTVARELFAVQRVDGFAFDVEVLLLARRRGLRITELPVTCVYYTQTSVRRVFDSLSMLRELGAIVWQDRLSRRR